MFLDNTFKSKWVEQLETVKGQLRDSMTQNEFYLLVSPLLAGLNDGHTIVICPYEQRMKYMNSGGLAFPFSVTLNDSSIFVSEYYGEEEGLFKGGEEIVEINRISSDAMLHEMQKLTGGDSKAIRDQAIATNFRSYLWMLYGFDRDYGVVIKGDSNKTTKIYVRGITNQRFLENKSWYTSKQQEPYALTTDTSTMTAILTLHTFADLSSFCLFADSAFTEIANDQTRNLIIDIRGNSGGRSVVVDSLMNYLTDKPYSQYQKIETRVSLELKAYYRDHYPEKFQQIKNYPTDYRAVTSGEKKFPIIKKNRFTGTLYLLTNSATYSGAATFAGLFKELKAGTIVGEETGGTIGYYGDFWTMTMPASRLQFSVSPKRFIQYGGSDLKQGVQPDYLIPDKNDSILSFTMQLIEMK